MIKLIIYFFNKKIFFSLKKYKKIKRSVKYLLNDKFVTSQTSTKFVEYSTSERIVRNRFQGKPAFFLNTFPKARPLKVCILLCIPTVYIRNNDPPRKGIIHYRRSIAVTRPRKNCLAASGRNMILAFARSALLTGRISITHSCRTADSPFHDPPGISAFFSPAPESASPYACLWEYFAKYSRETRRLIYFFFKY